MSEFPIPETSHSGLWRPSAGPWRSFLLFLSQWYAFLILGRDMGRGLGAISMDLTDQVLRGSVPGYEPPAEMLGQARSTVYDSNPSEILGRANRWSAVLESRVISGGLRVPARTVLTTYGFVAFKTGVRLSVIHYLEPGAIFRLRRRPAPAAIDGNMFPIIIRPAAFVPMAKRSRRQNSLSLRGNIWLKIQHQKSMKLGYLTARHAIEGAKLGDVVKPQTYRLPPPGVLVRRSKVMDCAVVRTDLDSGLSFKTVHPSGVLGYKPVRMITGEGDIDARVVELRGHFQGLILHGDGVNEPPERAIVLLNRHLGKGHSGCLVVDCEFEQRDKAAAPYAMYQAALSTYTGLYGWCQILEQPRYEWDLEFCEPWEEEDERKPRIG